MKLSHSNQCCHCTSKIYISHYLFSLTRLVYNDNGCQAPLNVVALAFIVNEWLKNVKILVKRAVKKKITAWKEINLYFKFTFRVTFKVFFFVFFFLKVVFI